MRGRGADHAAIVVGAKVIVRAVKTVTKPVRAIATDVVVMPAAYRCSSS